MLKAVVITSQVLHVLIGTHENGSTSNKVSK